MAKDVLSKVLLDAISGSTIDALKGIERLHVCRFADTATGATREGAILLAIARVDNDLEGDGFRYLIAVRHGTLVSSHLDAILHGS